MSDREQRIKEDLDALSGVPGRYAGTEGERAMLHAVHERVPQPDLAAIEPFVTHVSPAAWNGVHAAGLLCAGALGYWAPGVGAVACGLFTASLVGEGTGRFRLLRAWAPRTPSYNLTARLDAINPIGTVIVTAPLDVPRWRPQSRRWRRLRPMRVQVGAASLVTALLALRLLAEPWGKPSIGMYLVGLAVLAGSMLVGLLTHRATGAYEDASGPAALLELQRRLSEHPVPGLAVWLTWTASGRAFQGGMEAFLALHQPSLVEPALVVALDDPGRAPLYAVTSEGHLWQEPHRPTGPAMVERLRWAGRRIRVTDRSGLTDAGMALRHGLRGLALTGGEGEATAHDVDRAVDELERILRMFGDDLARIERPAPDEDVASA